MSTAIFYRETSPLVPDEDGIAAALIADEPAPVLNFLDDPESTSFWDDCLFWTALILGEAYDENHEIIRSFSEWVGIYEESLVELKILLPAKDEQGNTLESQLGAFNDVAKRLGYRLLMTEDEPCKFVLDDAELAYEQNDKIHRFFQRSGLHGLAIDLSRPVVFS